MMATSLTPANAAKRRTRLEKTLKNLGMLKELEVYQGLTGKARRRMATELNRKIQARRK